MGPLTVITGILLGSCLSISFSLAAVLLMFAIVGNEDPRLGNEFPALVGSLLIFVGLTAIAAASFYLTLKRHPARWLAQGIMWAGMVGAAFFYWP